MSLVGRAPRVSRLYLPATEHQKRLFEAAASHRGVTVTEFVLESAEKRAEEILGDERDFVLPPDHWKAFITALDGPVRAKPRLRRLLREEGVLERK